MLLLTRTVRFCIGQPVAGSEESGEPRHNSFAAWPSMTGLGRYYEIDVQCAGSVDPTTGYFLNIRAIDEAVRRGAIPLIRGVIAADPATEPWTIAGAIFAAVNDHLNGTVQMVAWRLTPFYSVSMEAPTMPQCVIRQQFEFAASHRLDCDGLSPQENRRIFGKCNNEAGHGHNYRSEGAVALDPADSKFSLPMLEEVVSRTVIERFDHKYLNVDCVEFAEVNPSVENIARVAHDLLDAELGAAGLDLRAVTVWETDKTSCTYPG